LNALQLDSAGLPSANPDRNLEPDFQKGLDSRPARAEIQQSHLLVTHTHTSLFFQSHSKLVWSSRVNRWELIWQYFLLTRCPCCPPTKHYNLPLKEVTVLDVFFAADTLYNLGS